MSIAFPRARRVLTSAVVAGLFVAGAGACASGRVPPPAAPAPGVSAGRELTGMVNDFRADNGQGGLAQAYDASAKAQALAQSMADQGRIFHSSDLASGIAAGWTKLAENVAAASSLAEAQHALEGSPGHRANLLGPYTQVGVGIAVGGDGRTYVAEEFVAR